MKNKTKLLNSNMCIAWEYFYTGRRYGICFLNPKDEQYPYYKWLRRNYRYKLLNYNKVLPKGKREF